MSDDRKKPGFRLNGRTNAATEAVAKASLAELSATVYFLNPLEWPSAPPECCARRATKGCPD
jgi:hypothetical protein